jgi:putative addiction module component (TIGR02574 family)
MDLSQLETELLSLPSEARAALAQKLLDSLEDVSEAEFDRLWGEESAKRAAQVDSGKVRAIPAEEVARKVRALLR